MKKILIVISLVIGVSLLEAGIGQMFCSEGLIDEVLRYDELRQIGEKPVSSSSGGGYEGERYEDGEGRVWYLKRGGDVAKGLIGSKLMQLFVGNQATPVRLVVGGPDKAITASLEIKNFKAKEELRAEGIELKRDLEMVRLYFAMNLIGLESRHARSMGGFREERGEYRPAIIDYDKSFYFDSYNRNWVKDSCEDIDYRCDDVDIYGHIDSPKVHFWKTDSCTEILCDGDEVYRAYMEIVNTPDEAIISAFLESAYILEAHGFNVDYEEIEKWYQEVLARKSFIQGLRNKKSFKQEGIHTSELLRKVYPSFAKEMDADLANAISEKAFFVAKKWIELGAKPKQEDLDRVMGDAVDQRYYYGARQWNELGAKAGQEDLDRALTDEILTGYYHNAWVWTLLGAKLMKENLDEMLSIIILDYGDLEAAEKLIQLGAMPKQEELDKALARVMQYDRKNAYSAKKWIELGAKPEQGVLDAALMEEIHQGLYYNANAWIKLGANLRQEGLGAVISKALLIDAPYNTEALIKYGAKDKQELLDAAVAISVAKGNPYSVNDWIKMGAKPKQEDLNEALFKVMRGGVGVECYTAEQWMKCGAMAKQKDLDAVLADAIRDRAPNYAKDCRALGAMAKQEDLDAALADAIRDRNLYYTEKWILLGAMAKQEDLDAALADAMGYRAPSYAKEWIELGAKPKQEDLDIALADAIGKRHNDFSSSWIELGAQAKQEDLDTALAESIRNRDFLAAREWKKLGAQEANWVDKALYYIYGFFA